MAYQPKSYRKFVATAATAAVVASAIAPAASAASFTDVATKYQEAVNYLVANNITTGNTETTFGTYASITRGDAAVMIAKALDLDTTNVEASGFSDLNSRYEGPVAALKALNVISGKTETTFDPYAPIKRGEMAKIIANAFELTGDADVTFTDVNSTWAPFVELLVANEITTGKTETTFGTDLEITRGDFAIFLFRAANLGTTVEETTVSDISGVEVKDANTIEVTFDGVLTEENLNLADFTIEGVELESVEIKAEAAAAATKTVVVIKTKTALTANTSLVLKYKGEYSLDTLFEVEFEVTTPEVTGVSAINLKQIRVSFNKEMDADTLEDLANFEVYDNGSSTKLAGTFLTEVSADGTSVLLTLVNDATTALTNLSNAKVVVKKAVKDADGTALAADYTATSVSANDNSRPVVTSVTQIAPTQLEVVFSEPVKDTSGGLTIGTDNFKLDNGSYIVTGVAAPDLENNTVVVTIGGTIANGEHTLTVNPSDAADLVDFAGFEVEKNHSFKFTTAADTAAPTATIKSVTQSSVTFKFDEPISNAKDGNVAYRHSFNNTTYQVLGSSANVTVNGAGTEVTVNFANAGYPLATGSATFFISYLSDGGTKIQDAFANKFAATSLTGTVTADTTKPTATVKVVENSNTQIDVEFSESVTGATTAANFVLKNSSNSTVAFTGPVLVSGNKYRLTASSPMQGNYTLEVKNIKDVSLSANAMDTQTFAISVADTIKPQVADESGTAGANFFTQGDTKHIRVYFTEAMNTEDLANKALYQNAVDGNANPTAVEVAADGTSVYLTFANNVSGSLVIGQFKDLAGNKMSTLSTTLTGTAGANIGLNSSITKNVVAESTSTIKVYLNDVLSSFDAADFQVDIDGGANLWVNPSNVAHNVENGKSVLTLTLAAPIAKDQWNTASPEVRTTGGTAATNTKNAFGKAVSFGPTAVSDKVTPGLVASSPISTLDVDRDGKIDHIKVTFTEDVAQQFVSADKFTVDGYTVVDAYSATTGTPTVDNARTGATVGNGEVVFIRVTEKASADYTAAPTVTIGSGIQDVAGNVFTFSTTSTTGIVSSASGVTLTATPTQGVAGVKASRAIADLTYTADATGTAGNSITVDYVAGVGNSVATSVAVTGNAITVTLGTDAGGLVNATATDVKNAIDGDLAAAALVDVAVTGTGTNLQSATLATTLTGGVTAVTEKVDVVFTAPTTNGTLAVNVNGVVYYVSVLSTDTAADVATKVNTAITAPLNWTKGVSGATVTLTSSNPGNVTDITVSALN